MFMVFDLETTGLGLGGERVVPVQFAGVMLDEQLREMDCFTRFFKTPEGAHVEEAAMKMHLAHGRDREFFAANGLPAEEFYPLLNKWVKSFGGKPTPSGQNVAAYDLPILKREWTRYAGAPWPMDHHPADTVALAFPLKYRGKIERVNLSALCAHFGIELKGAHDAVNDVRATAEVLRHLLAL